MPFDSTAIIVALIGSASGVLGALTIQWVKAKQESRKTAAETKKTEAEADKTAAETWRALYEEVVGRVQDLEDECSMLKTLVADVDFLKQENQRLKLKLNRVIAWYSNLYHQAVAAGVEPEFAPPEPEEIEEDEW